MRKAFAHQAVVEIDPQGDERALGGAITVELCGSLDHEPPCRLAAHHTEAQRVGDTVTLRVLFAAEPAQEAIVRERVGAALSAGRFTGPDQVLSEWRLLGAGPAAVLPRESDQADRLLRD